LFFDSVVCHRLQFSDLLVEIFNLFCTFSVDEVVTQSKCRREYLRIAEFHRKNPLVQVSVV